MLEFIVLGQVPGTDAVVTFQWVLITMTAIAIVVGLRHFIRNKHVSKLTDIEERTL